ncbi:related to 6-hydroxy-d-nicotine oxidase [Fusarium torulosum]|uniref:Related to 6-hydroxy-d-nicotine oxidase n=1 Tax=Fusarium torulosum TaxID=33205 RepID=A0AAE8SCC5_9HYPO|nr:related to 6-hydroxy-d-nicotine oxidase [Fusarium torulosum]
MKSSTSFFAWISSVLVASAVADTAVVETCCASLEAAGVKNVYYPDTSSYKTRTKSYFSVSSQLQPYCIVQPETARDVSVIIKTLGHSSQCKFAIRSGGHTVWAANNINDGVTIDMGLMNKTTYVKKTKVAQIQAGSIWRDVYEALEPYGVTAAGGRTSTVGVAGFLTGGGNTFYTARRGFGCDQVVNFEVVLADGRIVNANKGKNSDLWKALKGGSSNFGIVTRFDVQAFDAPLLWGGLVTYSTSTTDAHVQAYKNWTDNIKNYQDGSVIPFWSYTPQAGEIGITVSYEDTTGKVAPKALDDFWKIPYETSNLRKDSHRNMTVELELVAGYRNVWFAITFKNDLALYKKALDLHKQFVSDWKAQSPDGDFICHGIFQAIPTIFSQHSRERGGNVVGLDREKDNAVMFQVQLMINGVEQEKLARERMVRFRKEMKQYSVDQGGAVDWEYLNYADFTQDPLSTYGLENVGYIRQVAMKYDPKGIFQTRLPGGFKISKVAENIINHDLQ